ncbi:uncharacterized protein EDB93DRAFT_1250598 [Suillus bovinus]|uniref:uncharacterized protein n=1 Tax=Suillus bovinus TaxID=48563 RepID=UPI001B8866B6|nr:uncharacterized protein EDB93DRAFT_1250598 [Suillus bovinus]KAG2147454.1 hypothetical protein EDB93DRAFT_1250598 [Suillus bovinus]
MRFATLVALSLVASTVPSLAAPTSYPPRRGTSKRETALRNGEFVPPRIGTVVLPGETLSLGSKRDTTSDVIQAIEAAFNELPSARKRDITAEITAALQALLQEGSSALSDFNVKRQADSILPVEERSLISPTTSSWLKDIGSIISLGAGANAIVNAFDGSNSTRRDLDQTFDGVDVGEALGGAVPQFEDRSITIPSDITAALQALLQDGSSVLSDINVKRQAYSILPVEERSPISISPTASSWLKDIGSIISLGAGANAIVNAFDGSNSTRRDLSQTSDGVDVGEALGGAVPRFEDRSFTIPSSVSSVLGKVAGIVSTGGTIATVLSSLNDGSSNTMKRELDMGFEHVNDQKRASPSDIESILQQIITSFEGAADAANNTSTLPSTKRSTSDSGFLGLTDIITPEQLDELS